MQQLVGVVLCGGKSSRLGIDKCALDYHGEPQWRYTVKMLQPLCREVVVSCRNEQVNTFTASVTGMQMVSTCPDHESFGGQGPMSGVISAFERFPKASLLVAGCDYPLLTASDLKPLIESRSDGAAAVCYHLNAESLDIPFPAIYESSLAAALKQLYADGDYSLRTALKAAKTVRLQPPDPGHLASANSPGEVEHMRNRIAGRSRNI